MMIMMVITKMMMMMDIKQIITMSKTITISTILSMIMANKD